MKTYKDRLSAGLQALGWQQHRIQSSKYVAFTHPDYGELLLFVGNAGALRTGRCASDSVSIGDPTRQGKFYQRVLAACPAATAAPSLRSLAAEFGSDNAPASVATVNPTEVK